MEVIGKDGASQLLGKGHRPSRASFHLGVVLLQEPKGEHGIGAGGDEKVAFQVFGGDGAGDASSQSLLRADKMVNGLVQLLLCQRGDGFGARVIGSDDHIQLRAKTEGLAFRFGIHTLGATGDDEEVVQGWNIHLFLWRGEGKKTKVVHVLRASEGGGRKKVALWWV